MGHGLLLSREHGLWGSRGPVCGLQWLLGSWNYLIISNCLRSKAAENTGSEYGKDLKTIVTILTSERALPVQSTSFYVPPSAARWGILCHLGSKLPCPYLKAVCILISEIIGLKVLKSKYWNPGNWIPKQFPCRRGRNPNSLEGSIMQSSRI